MRADSVRSFLVFLEIAGAVFAVITWTTSFVASSLRLSPPNVDGTSPCARAPELKVTETNAVASARKISRLRTSARYAGNHKPRQAFFYIKIIGVRSLTGARVWARTGMTLPTPFQSSGKLSDPNPGGGPNIWSRSI